MHLSDGSIIHRTISATALTALVLAACSTDVVAPLKTPSTPKLAVDVNTTSGNYVVLMRGNAISKGFAESVANLGGAVTWSHAGAGFATVAGLDAAGAVKLAAISGVADVESDIEVGLGVPAGVAETDASDLADPSIMAEADASDLADPSISSVKNPAAAARYVWQWNMRSIGAQTAWAAGKLGSAAVTVAILDTGIDYDAPDLNGLVDLTRSTSFMSTYVRAPGQTKSDSSDNYISTRFFPTRNAISDYNGHGTNVATQVSSKAVALAGVTSKTKLIGVKVLGSNGYGSFGGILNGILWAADHGANVANMSLGGGFSKTAAGRYVAIINRVFNYAKQRGMLIVVAAGNDAADLDHNGNEFVTYCDAPHVICVASVGLPTATGDADAPAFYSNFGRSAISVAAPGGNASPTPSGYTISTWPWGNDIASWVWSYCSKTRIARFTAPPATYAPILTVCVAGNRLSGFIGTSQASPHVAGLAALLMAEYGTGQPQTIKKLIQESAVPIDPLYGRGRISVSNALGL